MNTESPDTTGDSKFSSMLAASDSEDSHSTYSSSDSDDEERGIPREILPLLGQKHVSTPNPPNP